jgi:fructokinase
VNSPRLYGAIEAGGTKFLCLVGSAPGSFVDQRRIDTSTPLVTLGAVIDFFEPYCQTQQVRTIGIGCFGPLDLDEASPTFGTITSTPKPGWRDIDVLMPLRTSLGVRLVLDTDVNAAALGECTWGATVGVDPSLYLTVGTGIGGSFLSHGKPLHGMEHPEMGHISISHGPLPRGFLGACPFHADCFEGLASGPAIQKRLGIPARDVPDADPFWATEAEYVGTALAMYVLVLSPRRIVLGGGIMQRQFLFPMIRAAVVKELGGYVQNAAIVRGIDRYIVPPGLGTNSGLLGALAMAIQAEP